jgi:hypothetical protein
MESLPTNFRESPRITFVRTRTKNPLFKTLARLAAQFQKSGLFRRAHWTRLFFAPIGEDSRAKTNNQESGFNPAV